MGETLLPCPFCGSRAVLDPHSRPDGEHYVYCSNWRTTETTTGYCQCDLGSFETKAEAIAAWNRRAAPEMLAVVEALAKITDYSLPRSELATLVMNARAALSKVQP